VLASQTIAGISGLGRHTLNQIKTRVALQSSEVDSRLLLADDNEAARLLSRPGEGILNTKGGLKDANVTFQSAFWPVEERVRVIRDLRARATGAGFDRRPVVFSGREPATVLDAPETTFTAAVTGTTVQVPLGLPLTLDPPVTAPLRREPGGNLLLVCGDDDATGVLTVAVTALAASGVEVDVCNYGALDGPWNTVLDGLASSGRVRVARRREALARLEDLAKMVATRHDLSDFRAAPRVLLLSALHRAREFDTGGYDSGPEAELLATILRDGPDVGVHVLAWCDKPISVERRIPSQALREFGLRVLGRTGASESYALIGSEAAAQLNPVQSVFDDHDRGVTVRLRRFAAPDAAWWTGLVR
jgi:DNA segregation ATPase FtsK/SpoIIIE-like protein